MACAVATRGSLRGELVGVDVSVGDSPYHKLAYYLAFAGVAKYRYGPGERYTVEQKRRIWKLAQQHPPHKTRLVLEPPGVSLMPEHDQNHVVKLTAEVRQTLIACGDTAAAALQRNSSASAKLFVYRPRWLHSYYNSPLALARPDPPGPTPRPTPPQRRIECDCECLTPSCDQYDQGESVLKFAVAPVAIAVALFITICVVVIARAVMWEGESLADAVEHSVTVLHIAGLISGIVLVGWVVAAITASIWCIVKRRSRYEPI
eukprot:TRINITY_DN17162_c0_g1_i1.p1 TRINITY_DN17162_c0_g1~~TRINITY_DN17162_c0_g1_i1.p1  ORF type:complete len:261 (+),score=24.35 TRINITY_DN17162_c0_g1_i1:3-785(+)